MVATAAQQEVLLVELIVIVVEVAHRYHALTVVLVDLSIDAIARYATDVGIVGLTDLVTHKLHHLVLDRVALRVLRHLLHVGAVLAQILVMLLVG